MTRLLAALLAVAAAAGGPGETVDFSVAVDERAPTFELSAVDGIRFYEAVRAALATRALGTPEDYIRHADRMYREAGPLVEELHSLIAQYEFLKDPETVSARRAALRRRAAALTAEYWFRRKYFAMLRSNELSREAGTVFARARSGSARDSGYDFLERGLALETADAGVRGDFQKLGSLLKAEWEAYERAVTRARKRRFQEKAAAAAGIVLLAGLAVLGVRAWRRRKAAAAARRADVVGGHFRMERTLGSGGMGVVFLAQDAALGRKVAVKRMRPEVAKGPKEYEMFLAEARVVAALKHPNLVEIYHIFSDNGAAHLVFEFVEGHTLEQVLSGGEAMRPDRVLDILGQVARGLDYAHENKVIHRDLKPANLMLTPEGTVKIMDFGLAHRVQRTMARQTKAAAWGTPPYMAPEQELGKVSKESDIFALGACVYEMLAGRPAFEGPNYLAQKREMRFDRAGLPQGLTSAVAKALEAEPAKRYPSGAEFFNAFLTALGGKPAA